MLTQKEKFILKTALNEYIKSLDTAINLVGDTFLKEQFGELKKDSLSLLEKVEEGLGYAKQ